MLKMFKIKCSSHQCTWVMVYFIYMPSCYRTSKEFKFNEHPDNAAIITKDFCVPAATEMNGLPPPKESSSV